MPNGYWHDTVRSAVRWVARRGHLGSIRRLHPPQRERWLTVSVCWRRKWDSTRSKSSLASGNLKGMACELRVGQKRKKMCVAIFFCFTSGQPSCVPCVLVTMDDRCLAPLQRASGVPAVPRLSWIAYSQQPISYLFSTFLGRWGVTMMDALHIWFQPSLLLWWLTYHSTCSNQRKNAVADL